MKKSCILLLTIISLTYGYQGYLTIRSYYNDELKIKTSGQLSDITSNVIPVQLETPDSGIVKQIKRVQRDGDDIFLIGDNRLLHFDISGNFINQLAMEISDNEDVFIANYTLDTQLHQVILIDSQRNILKYNYSGDLLSKSKINQPWRSISAFAYYNGYLWTTAEKVVINADDNSIQVTHSLYQLDSEMNEISSQTLHYADVGRDILFHSFFVDELLVDEHGVYAYSSPADMKYLLEDTLNILLYKEIPMMSKTGHYGKACVYPIRKGKHLMISTYCNEADNCYTFCYDNTNHTAYLLSEGFNDNFYKTGHITDLQSMDIYNKSYCYIKSGDDLSDKFPDREKNNNNPILFLVTLKS